MKNHLLHLYHRLPYAGRVLAASLRGYYLRFWRYGPETARLVAAARERETWSPERWQAWQQERLALVLHRAVTQVPYYREQWAARRRQGDRASWEYLENWPILEKEAVRAHPKAFVADDCAIGQMYEIHTSGTTGKPLTLWQSRSAVRQWYALFEARWRGWYGVSRQDRWAILGGQLVMPVARRQPPFWVWNHGLKQLYLSSYHLAPDLLPSYLDALVAHNIVYLWGYTSSLYALAQEVLRSGRQDVAMKVVITNAEPVYEYQRQVIGAAFRCPVRETYGMTEMVAAASECAYGRLHLWPEAGIVEVLAEGQKVPAGETGELVCTGLINADMPLVRYRVGDRGALSPEKQPCSCGRTLPILQQVEGRVDDVLYTSDGRQVGRLDPVFKADLPIREAQIIQESLQQVRVRYVPSPEYTEAAGQVMVDQLQARLGEMKIVLEAVKEIPRGPNGKFQAVVCRLAPELVKTLREKSPAGGEAD